MISETIAYALGTTVNTEWNYNTRDQAATTTYPGGEVVTSGYDLYGRPVSLAGSSTYVSSASYNKFDQFTLVQYGNATRTTYEYYPDYGDHPYGCGSSIPDRMPTPMLTSITDTIMTR